MWQRESQLPERCPSCDVPVYAGPILKYDPNRDIIDVGDIRGETCPCPRCGTELSYEVDREWDDHCYVCGGDTAGKSREAEWQAKKQRYRWWCEHCSDNLLASLVAELSPRLARVLWYPLSWSTSTLFRCYDAFESCQRRRRK
jgi:ribosomal protein L37E